MLVCCLFYYFGNMVGIKWFFDKIIGFCLYGFDGYGDIFVFCD